MTLGMGLIVLGFANVWQLQSVQTGSGVPPELRTLGTGLTADVIPNNLAVLVPVAVLVILLLKRTGYGRMLYAIGDNPVAARLSGVRSWQVLLVLYVHLGPAGRHRRAAPIGSVEHGQRLARHAVPAAVGRRRGHRRDVDPGRPRRATPGTIVGALILTVLAGFLSIILPEPWRQIVFGSIVVLVAAAYTRVTAAS